MPKKNESLDPVDEILREYESKMPETVYLVKNKVRYEAIVKSIKTIKKFVKAVSPDAKTKIKPGGMNKSSIYFKVITDEIIFKNVGDFCAAIQAASNIEFYPREDGNIAMSILYNGAYDIAPAYEEIHKNDIGTT